MTSEFDISWGTTLFQIKFSIGGFRCVKDDGFIISPFLAVWSRTVTAWTTSRLVGTVKLQPPGVKGVQNDKNTEFCWSGISISLENTLLSVT